MECRLLSCSSNNYQIVLPDRQKIILGRGPLTRIKDKKCSREQVEITADYESKEIELKQLGRNPSSIGSTLVNQGEVQVLGPGGVFSFLQGKHSFSVQFFDKLVSTKNDSPLQKNDITKGIKGMFKSLRRSMSRESLASLDDVKVMTASPQNDSSKKRKREREIDETRSNESSKKLRKSVSGTLTSCITGNEESGIDINDLKMEFGEDIVREINCDRSSLKLVGEEIFNDMKTDAGISDDNFTWNSAVNSDSKVTKNTWVTQEGLMVFSGKGLEAKEKIASYDLDGTLICTKSGKKFPTSTDDWKLLFANVKTKLKQQYDNDFKIVIFTNQKGLGKFKVSVEGFKDRIEKIQDELGIPLQCFVATAVDRFRKPMTGMWQELCSKCNGGQNIDILRSFYVGDAAGRPVNWDKGKKKDFSCGDRCFAANIDIPFHTPEEHFLNWNKSKFDWPQFDPRKLRKDIPLLHPDCTKMEIAKNTQEVIIMVGSPACYKDRNLSSNVEKCNKITHKGGKSSFSKKYLIAKGYVHINRDTMGTWQKCVAACQAAISQGKSVVVDNTNADKKTRQRYVAVAAAKNIPVRCFQMMTSFDHSLHNNKFRELTTTDKDYKHVGQIAFNIYKSSFEEPRLNEGFTEIVKVNFVPFFTDKRKEKLYYSFL